MPDKRKLVEFKSKIKKKMKKIEQMLEKFASSDSDSDDAPASVSEHEDDSETVDQQKRQVIETPLDDILGAYPLNDNTEGPEIAADLAIRWQSYLSSGLDKDTRKSLLEQ
ncbi:hypothetical protein ABEB36_014846 [Hypothenemus hampei]|uniref:Uncharacterized protein n=1 Tax=Hypothenemus hampei TaxID=57062 RepID=A0ABD1E1B7_HYPHA